MIALVIVAFCVVVHVGGIVALAHSLLARVSRVDALTNTTLQAVVLIFVFGVVLALHAFEIGVWATFFYWCGLFGDLETATYFSLGTYVTIGYGDVVLPQHWRVLGAIEGLAGVLLSGLSAAFIFAVVNALFQMRISQRNLPAPEDGKGLSKVTVSPVRPLQ